MNEMIDVLERKFGGWRIRRLMATRLRDHQRHPCNVRPGELWSVWGQKLRILCIDRRGYAFLCGEHGLLLRIQAKELDRDHHRLVIKPKITEE